MLAGRDRPISLDKEMLQTAKVVAIFWFAAFGVETESAGDAAGRQNDTLCARFGHHHLSGQGVRFV